MRESEYVLLDSRFRGSAVACGCCKSIPRPSTALSSAQGEARWLMALRKTPHTERSRGTHGRFPETHCGDSLICKSMY